MEDAVYKTIELTGSSKTDMEGAIQNAISKASETVRNMRWFQVVDTRGYIEGDRVSYWQVTLKVGFNVEGAEKGASTQTKAETKEAGKSKGKYRCTVCGYIYNPEKGDPDNGIKAGTPFKELPDDWVCPECGVGKERFEAI